MDRRVQLSEEAIICASRIENVNIRGRLIEALITANPTQRNELIEEMRNISRSFPKYNTHNDLGDYQRTFQNGDDTFTDIKTKIIYLDSNPKAYNIDKFLECMCNENSIFLFYFIGIDEASIINKILCSVYHDKLLDHTVVQTHWAGRATRGVTQLIGKAINQLLADKGFCNQIDIAKTKSFLDKLIALQP